MKTQEQHEARQLRALGWSVREIEQHLGVSRSSVSHWVRDVYLDAAARRRLDTRTMRGPMIAAERSRARARAIRAGYQQEGRLRARERDPEYAAGCMLHWAEGDKTRNAVRFANSDPELLATFMRFLRNHFDVLDRQMTIACNLFADHIEHQMEIEDFWLGKLGLPHSQLRKTMLNIYSKHSQKKRQNKLPYGTCKLVVHSTRIQQMIYGSIQELGGFDRPEWLD